MKYYIVKFDWIKYETSKGNPLFINKFIIFLNKKNILKEII